MRWWSLSENQKVLLAAYTVLVCSDEETSLAELPKEYVSAAMHLAGKVRKSPSKRVKYRMEPDIQSNDRRKIRASVQAPRLVA